MPYFYSIRTRHRSLNICHGRLRRLIGSVRAQVRCVVGNCGRMMTGRSCSMGCLRRWLSGWAAATQPTRNRLQQPCRMACRPWPGTLEDGGGGWAALSSPPAPHPPMCWLLLTSQLLSRLFLNSKAHNKAKMAKAHFTLLQPFMSSTHCWGDVALCPSMTSAAPCLKSVPQVPALA